MKNLGEARECRENETFRCNGVAVTLMQFGFLPGSGQLDGYATWDLVDSFTGRRWAMRDPFKAFSQGTQELVVMTLNAVSLQLRDVLPGELQCREFTLGVQLGMPRAECRYDICYEPVPDSVLQAYGVGTMQLDVAALLELLVALEESILEDISTFFFMPEEGSQTHQPDQAGTSALR